VFERHNHAGQFVAACMSKNAVP